ncbi:ShlB/FhaC/HecB family hemolysin secretion/activation protein [soil metagenome]
MGTAVALAQVVPDAGQLLRQETPRPVAVPPRASPKLDIGADKAAVSSQLPGGQRVTLKDVQIQGQLAVSKEELIRALGPVIGQSFDFAGLQQLAARVTQSLRGYGYSFSRAYLPAQNLTDGVLRIAVLEGRYGKVSVVSADSQLAQQAQPWFAGLAPGERITSGPLERSLLLLDDLPGIQASARLEPGADLGTGDLHVQVERSARYTGAVGVDNHGNRYSGKSRGYFNLDINSPFVFGDQISLRGSYSSQGTWLGSAAYSLPLGTDGWRAQIGASRTQYELGKEFANLQAHGTADAASAGLGYALLRTQDRNLRLGIQLQTRRLQDKQDATLTSASKTAQVVPISIAGDLRDAYGVTWGNITFASGNLSLDAGLRAVDGATARTEGRYTKVNADLARLQPLTPNMTLYGRLSLQQASKNLDSSEKLSLGGPAGVRAWPSGEAAGDEGQLIQAELRLQTDWGVPFFFIDAGSVRISRNPWLAGNNQRSIKGSGFGLRSSFGQWRLEASLGWRSSSQRPTTEPGARQPQLWIALSREL